MNDHRNPAPDVELVVVAVDQAATLERSVRRLHRHLVAGRHDRWALTIVDNGSMDDTPTIAGRLAADLPATRAVRLTERVARRDLRRRWAGSHAPLVAFLTVDPDSDLERLLAPIAAHGRPQVLTDHAVDFGIAPAPLRLLDRGPLSRRRALVAMGGIGLTAVVAACGAGSSTSGSTTTATAADRPPTSTSSGSASASASASTSTSSGSSTTAGTADAVALAPEMTEGPYYLDLDLVRRDITEDRKGAALALGLTVVDVGSGSPVQGAAVDIWHTDAEGIYSGFVDASGATDDSTFMRGTQMTDAAGTVTFATLYPGWYSGRTTHIHVKVHVSGAVIHTGQLFFDDAFTDAVYAANAPYASRSARDVRNADDSIYAAGGKQSTVVVQRSGDGYATDAVMGVKAT